MRDRARQTRAAKLAGQLGDYGARPGDRVLELGCGTGEGLIALITYGYLATGVDADPGVLRRARAQLALVPQHRATVRRLSLDRPLPFADGAFDHAMCASALHCAADPGRLVAEAVRVVAPRGVVLLASATGEPDGLVGLLRQAPTTAAAAHRVGDVVVAIGRRAPDAAPLSPAGWTSRR